MNSDMHQPGATQQPQDKAGQLADQAKHQVADVAQQAQDKAIETVEQQKGRAADTVGAVANALRTTSRNLREQDQGAIGHIMDQAAGRLEQFSNDLQTKNVQEMLDDVQNFARRDPQIFLGGALVLGLLAARFLKASVPPTPGYGSNYGSGLKYGSSSGYSQADLSQYRRDVLKNEYTGTYPQRSYGQSNAYGQQNPSQRTPNQPATNVPARKPGVGMTGSTGMTGNTGMTGGTGSTGAARTPTTPNPSTGMTGYTGAARTPTTPSPSTGSSTGSSTPTQSGSTGSGSGSAAQKNSGWPSSPSTSDKSGDGSTGSSTNPGRTGK